MSLKTIGAVVFVLLALLHSALGEKDILRPLFAQKWDIGLPKKAVHGLLRFAWHLTSIAWMGIAGAILGLPLLPTGAWVAFLSGVLILILLRGHLAWPLFLFAAGCLWEFQGEWPGGPLIPSLSLGSAALLSVGLAVLHGYWALGGTWGMDHVIPRRTDERPYFSPGPVACLSVSCALLIFCFAMIDLGLGGQEWWSRWIVYAATVFLILRAVGDGKQVGFSKSDRSTSFAQYDDALFTPLVVVLLFGALSALSM